jgi:dihydrofolate synthase / folylpolyglutamate synthase
MSDQKFIKYRQAVSFLESTINFPVKKNLLKRKERTFYLPRFAFLLKRLNNPHLGCKYIHITGTSGKGTVANYLHNTLTAAGINVGSYFSPHTTTTIERIKFNDLLISPKEFAELIEYLKPFLSQVALASPYGHPSYYETLLALAFLYFKQKKCEYVILEAGLGGANDASNIIPSNTLALITNINLDHQEVLGKTLISIAKEKSGIIKKGSILLTTETRPEILKIFQKRCQQVKAGYMPLKTVEKNRNKLLASQASELIGVDKQHIDKGLKSAKLPCRFEIIQKKPLTILDGAHNPSKMRYLSQNIKSLKYHKLHLLCAMAADKDHYNSLKYIIPLADKLYLTRFLMPFRKTADLQKLNKIAKKLKPALPITTSIDPWQALGLAQKNIRQNDLLLITGSFFLTGELRKNWINEETILINRKSYKS